MNSYKKLHTKVIVFEGGDCCGKTTMLEKVKQVFVDKYGEEKVGQFKFPVYKDKMCGEDILTHLKTFDYSKLTKEEAFEELERMSNMQYLNKIDAFSSFYNYCKDKEYVFVDRFTLSEFVYDYAWNFLFNLEDAKRGLFDEIYRSDILNKPVKIMHLYQEMIPHIVTVLITKNDMIKVISLANNAYRRTDNYDKNKEYQDIIDATMKSIVATDIYEMPTLDGNRPTQPLYDVRLNFLTGENAIMVDSNKNIYCIENEIFNTDKDKIPHHSMDDNMEDNILDYVKHKDNWMKVLDIYTKNIVNFIVEEVN